MPDWRDDLSTAVGEWLKLEKRGGSSTGKWIRVGMARHEEGGWWTVDLRGREESADDLDRLRLAGPAGPERDTGHGILDIRIGDEIVRVRTSGHFTGDDYHLWRYKQPPSFLIESIRQRIAALNDPGIADTLARGRPTTTPLAAPPGVSHLNLEQALAYAACLSPGLRLVWGPPGTGKTAVLSRAIQDLLTAGKRVLLVSATNIAVDNALLGVARNLHPEPGRLVRIGPPQLPEIARDDRIALPRLAATASQNTQAAWQAVEDRLVALCKAADRIPLLEGKLAGYDHNAYERAAGLLAAEQRIERLAGEALLARQRVDAAEDMTRHAREANAAAQLAVEQVAEADRRLIAAEELQTRLQDLEIGLGKLQADVMALEDQRRRANEVLRTLGDGGWSLRPGARRQRRNAEQAATDANADLVAAVERERSARSATGEQRRLLEPRIGELRRRAAPFDRAEIDRRHQARDAAHSVLRDAEASLDQARRSLAAAQEALLAAEAGPRAGERERRLVADAERGELPERHAELTQLRARVAAEQPLREDLERQQHELLEQIEKLRRDAEGAIIERAQLVATTLARFRLTSAAYNRHYDAVLVDEVGAATIPEVLLAVAKARTTAVLLGDFLQLPAIVQDRLRESQQPATKHWLGQDVFGLCGIRTPEDAVGVEGCVVLRRQYRFGPAVMRLANDTVYHGNLLPGLRRPSDAGSPEDPPEIVLLDTDGLEDLGTVRRTGKAKGWWPAGTLLARILVQRHRGAGQRATVGVVTPYGPQAAATLEALRDVEGPGQMMGTDVGTVHRFQGREFDVVVFDMVEDGGYGWVSSARPDGTPWERDGVRLFNVAVTRTKQQLYLIGSRAKVMQARRQSVLWHVRELVRSGAISTVRAIDLLRPVGAVDADAPDLTTQQLAEAVGKYVRVVGIHDERSYFQVLPQYLDSATSSVWMWAPWVSKRVTTLLPTLQAAVDRGVAITIFVRTDKDRLQGRDELQAWLAELRVVVPNIVRYHKMHEKIVVIDRRLTMLGSCNSLSHALGYDTSREVMVVHEGRHFAEKLLSHERAEEFSTPPACSDHGHANVELHRSGSVRKGFPWTWRCSITQCKWTRAVPDRR